MTKIPIACTLSHDGLIKRQEELKALGKLVCEIRQTTHGFALQFDGTAENFMAIAQVLAQERLCCRFLRFQLIAEPDMGPLWLDVSGPDNSTQFLLTMFGFDQELRVSSDTRSNSSRRSPTPAPKELSGRAWGCCGKAQTDFCFQRTSQIDRTRNRGYILASDW